MMITKQKSWSTPRAGSSSENKPNKQAKGVKITDMNSNTVLYFKTGLEADKHYDWCKGYAMQVAKSGKFIAQRYRVEYAEVTE